MSSGLKGPRSTRQVRPRQPTLEELDRQARAALKAEQRAAVAATEHALTTLHTAEFPAAQLARVPSPAPPGDGEVGALARTWRKDRLRGVSIFDRAQRRRIDTRCRADAAAELHRRYVADVVRAQHVQLEEDLDWASLLDHDPERVIERIALAFDDNDSVSTCVDAGVDSRTGNRYATCLIMYGSPDMIPDVTPAVTPGGKPTLRKRTKTDRNALYLLALASTILVTVKEALAVSPSSDEIRVLVVRAITRGPGPAGHTVEPIYRGSLLRETLESVDWARVDPVRAIRAANGADICLKGVTRQVVPLNTQDPDIRPLLDHVEQALFESER